VARAYQIVRQRYNWQAIARMTADVYEKVIAARAETRW
jgi:hypothetical protein